MSNFASSDSIRIELPSSGRMCTLISSSGKSYSVAIEYARLSEHLKDTLDISMEEENPTFDLPQINDNTLRSIIVFLEEYFREPFQPIPFPLPKEGLYSLLRPFYRDFLNIKMVADGTCDTAVFSGEPAPDSSTLVELLSAASLLRIKSLHSLVKAKMFDTVRGKNIKDMFKIFNIEDHVPDWKDIEQIRTDYAHMFETEPTHF